MISNQSGIKLLINNRRISGKISKYFSLKKYTSKQYIGQGGNPKDISILN